MKIFLLTALLSISFINVASTINQTETEYVIKPDHRLINASCCVH
jgi:hypothetical protein